MRQKHKNEPPELNDETLSTLAKLAWDTRSRAHVVGHTAVGAAVLTRDGDTFVGCNVEHQFRCHDVHAEVNAISAMVAGGSTELVAIVVVAERDRFTPCGGCMDWIFQFGGGTCVVAFQGKRDGPFLTFSAEELMPHYPA